MERQFENEEMREARWAQRKEEMKREKKKQELFRKAFKIGILLIAVITLSLTMVGMRGIGKRKGDVNNEADVNIGQESLVDAKTEVPQNEIDLEEARQESSVEDKVDVPVSMEQMDNINVQKRLYEYAATENTIQLGTEINSSNAIFVDTENGTILASKDEKNRIVPASMTKVLTLLVAVEHIGNFDDTFQITGEILDYCFVNDCSGAGFEKGETVMVKDLLYGTILPSGADAALGLAYYVAGSQEAFVALMNQKIDELGLSETAHFTNCVGIYDTDHYCTIYDLAIIMEAAIENTLCREVLSAHTYTTSATEQHPDGIILSNWFLRRIEDKDTGGEVVCGKTGYVVQSGSCAVSYGVSKKGEKYICVTANATSQWKCIDDHASIYKHFSELKIV